MTYDIISALVALRKPIEGKVVREAQPRKRIACDSEEVLLPNIFQGKYASKERDDAALVANQMHILRSPSNNHRGNARAFRGAEAGQSAPGSYGAMRPHHRGCGFEPHAIHFSRLQIIVNEAPTGAPIDLNAEECPRVMIQIRPIKDLPQIHAIPARTHQKVVGDLHAVSRTPADLDQ